jgi:hypothetical protein
VSSSSDEEAAASSQESATGALVTLSVLGGEIESFLRELSRPKMWLEGFQQGKRGWDYLGPY